MMRLIRRIYARGYRAGLADGRERLKELLDGITEYDDGGIGFKDFSKFIKDVKRIKRILKND